MSVDGTLSFLANSHGLNFTKGGEGCEAQPPAFANRLLVEKLLEGISIDGVPFFEAASHGLWGRRPPDLETECSWKGCCTECPLMARNSLKQVRMA